MLVGGGVFSEVGSRKNFSSLVSLTQHFYKIHISVAANRHAPFQYAKYVGFFSFYALQQKVARYYVIPSELLSVCPSVCPSVRPSVSG